MRVTQRIGIDFDNTLVTYNDVFRSAAHERGLIDAGFAGPKQAIRDHIRLLPDGELTWQRLQGHVYGKGIAGAAMFDGVDAFLRRCRASGVDVVIVSHKTEYGHYDPDRVNLRDAARGWMRSRGFFDTERYAIKAGNVYFEGTRAEKLARIASLDCTHFIDDLEEVLDDPGFPPGVERILFSEVEKRSHALPYVVCPTWREIEDHVFARR